MNGRVILQNYSGDVTKPNVTVTAYAPGTTTVVAQSTVNLGADGSYSVSWHASGAVDLVIKASHWLSTRQSVTLAPAGVLADTSLVNGDIDGNNTVNIVDYATLSDAFNKANGDAGFVPDADLDGNDAINIVDYSILSDNFNKTGQ